MTFTETRPVPGIDIRTVTPDRERFAAIRAVYILSNRYEGIGHITPEQGIVVANMALGRELQDEGLQVIERNIRQAAADREADLTVRGRYANLDSFLGYVTTLHEMQTQLPS